MKSVWTHKKYKTEFTGSYQTISLGSRTERVFLLSNGKVNKSYESHQAAKRDGWVKK